jgi:hypothetical protein
MLIIFSERCRYKPYRHIYIYIYIYIKGRGGGELRTSLSSSVLELLPTMSKALRPQYQEKQKMRVGECSSIIVHPKGDEQCLTQYNEVRNPL